MEDFIDKNYNGVSQLEVLLKYSNGLQLLKPADYKNIDLEHENTFKRDESDIKYFRGLKDKIWGRFLEDGKNLKPSERVFAVQLFSHSIDKTSQEEMEQIKQRMKEPIFQDIFYENYITGDVGCYDKMERKVYLVFKKY